MARGRRCFQSDAANQKEAIGEALRSAFALADDSHELQRMKGLIDKLKEIEMRPEAPEENGQ